MCRQAHIIREANIIRRSRHHLPKANIIQKKNICLGRQMFFFCWQGRKDSVSRDLRARSSAALDSPPDCQFTTASPSSPFLVCTNEKQVHRKSDGLVFGRGERTRTLDMRFWRPPFYQLNYTPISC